jgi:hypothetical protein
VSELRFVPPPSRAALRRALRGAIARLGRPLRALAEDVCGLGGTIDLVAAEPSGRVVLVLVAEAGEDLELVGHALAQRAWLAPRLGDWLQLAPDLGIRSHETPSLLLVAPDFGDRARAAAAAVDAEGIGLARYRCVADDAGGPARVLLETITAGSGAAGAGARRSVFRTGLTDDLLQPEGAPTH